MFIKICRIYGEMDLADGTLQIKQNILSRGVAYIISKSSRECFREV